MPNMSQPIVLVIFYSRNGSTEKLALAAAVGAVQSRALIRLRRLDDVDATSECTETLTRLRKEYIAPRETDVLAADGLIFVAPAGFNVSSPEWTHFISLLRKLSSDGKLAGKAATVIDTGDHATLISFDDVVTDLGLFTVMRDSTKPDRVDQATALGRKLAELLREPPSPSLRGRPKGG
jgi:NAD(P)H dehydrogenase (quinone)